MELFLYVCGIACILYYLRIILYAGIGAAFSKIWIVFFVIFMGSGIGIHLQANAMIHIPDMVRRGIFILFAIGMLAFLAVEAILIYYGNASPKENADYMIILGAKVNGTVPSKTLRRRVLATIPYLKNNENTTVLVSGGQGKGELVTEAVAMKQLLVEQGISEQRILLEDQSVNTEQNIRFSKEMIIKEGKKAIKDCKVVIATSDFHIFRGISLAKKQGFKMISGCAGKSDRILFVHYYVREFFAVVKDKMLSHI